MEQATSNGNHYRHGRHVGDTGNLTDRRAPDNCATTGGDPKGDAASQGGAGRRHRRPTALLVGTAVMLLGVLLAACGPAPSSSARPAPHPASSPSMPRAALHEATSFAAAGCPGRSAEIVQDMNGAISSCLRVGNLASGSYHVVLEQMVRAKPSTAGMLGPSVAVHLSPAAGPPGTTVTITARLGSAPSSHPGYANACWDGCRDGLDYSGVALHWGSPTSFTTTMVVPAAPWIEANPDRVLMPRSGSYPVGIECLGYQRGCGLDRAEGSRPFRLEAPTTGLSWCPGQRSCAQLSATPRGALPGQVVTVTGHAPLVSVIGSDHPFAFQLSVEPGVPSGPEVRFVGVAKTAVTGVVQAHFGHARLAVHAPPTLASLASTVPRAEEVDGLSPIAAEAGDPSVVAWCAPGHVSVDGPGGRRQVPLVGAAAVLEQEGFGLFGTTSPRCVAVTPLTDPRGGPPTVAVGFVAAPHGQAPPVADVALITTDGGSTWSPLPDPPGASPGDFGGFVTHGTTLDALFSAPPAGSEAAHPTAPLVEATDDGGVRWHPTAFSCPGTGPCVAFGAYLPGNCAMNGSFQTLLYSTDGGRRWRTPSWPTSVDACEPATLAALSSTTELLLDPGSPYVARLSVDGGAHWQVLGIPSLPGQPRLSAFDPGDDAVLLLPDGSLLAWRNRNDPTRISWDLLAPHSTRWCSATASVGASAQRFISMTGYPTVLGDGLWWQTQAASSDGADATAVTTHYLALSTLAC